MNIKILTKPILIITLLILILVNSLAFVCASGESNSISLIDETDFNDETASGLEISQSPNNENTIASLLNSEIFESTDSENNHESSPYASSEDGDSNANYLASNHNYIRVRNRPNEYSNDSPELSSNAEPMTWYIDGTIATEGNGSYSNPFKTLKKAIESSNNGDTILIKPGIYLSSNNLNLTINKNVNLARWGESGEVIFDGEEISKIFTVNSEVNISSITFKNGVSDFGGAITLNKLSNIINCTFINNFARYGGAVSIGEKTDSNFINCIFRENSASVGGGAIYFWEGTHNIINSTFNNSFSQIGGAIISLYNNLILNNTLFTENHVLSFGGAIYNQFGQLTILNGDFANNSAYYDGGAIYIANGTVNLKDSSFEENTANYGGGAIHSLGSLINTQNIILANNISSSRNGIVETLYINSFIDLGDYMMIIANTSNFNGTIPSYFNLADNGWDTSIKDQGNLGICWDYSTLATIETAVKKATGIELDLSEENLKNLMAMYSIYGSNKDPNDGDYVWRAYAYLFNALGPILELQDPTSEYGYSPLLNSVLLLSNIVSLCRDRNNPLDNDEIKEAIMKYGAVRASLSIEGKRGSNYYQNSTTSTSHSVAIVGWDDSYSRYNFPNNCPGDGAWIVKDSWGTGNGDNGYIYVSYYDTSFAWDDLTFVIFNNTVQYDRLYQYDYGYYMSLQSTSQELSYKNIYTSVANEVLTAFSSFFFEETDWTVYVYVEDELKFSQSGKAMGTGYFTFNLNEPVEVSEGESFTIELKINKNKIPIVSKVFNSLSCGEGVSFYSNNNGRTWHDLNNLQNKAFVAILKAYTINVYNSIISIEEIENVTYSNPVIINFHAANHSAINYLLTKDGKIISGKENISSNTIVLNDLACGNYTITISTENSQGEIDYFISANFTVRKADSSIEINEINDVHYGNDVNIDFSIQNQSTISYYIKDNMGELVIPKTVISSNLISIPDLNAASGKITIPNLNAGNYIITLENSENENYAYSSATRRFSVLKITPNLEVNVSNAIYPNDIIVSIKSDADGTYTLRIGNINQTVVLKSNIIKTVSFECMDVNVYNLSVELKKTNNYNSINRTVTFEILKGQNNIRIEPIANPTYPNSLIVNYISMLPVEASIVNRNTGEIISIPNGQITSNRITFNGLNLGDYTIRLYSNEGANFEAATAEANFTVSNTPQTMPTESNNDNYGGSNTNMQAGASNTPNTNLQTGASNTQNANLQATSSESNSANAKLQATSSQSSSALPISIIAEKTFKVKKSAKFTVIPITVGQKARLSKKVKFQYKGKNKISINFGKDIKDQTVNLVFKGKAYNVKVNGKGIGILKLSKNIAKKLKNGKKYIADLSYDGLNLYRNVKISIQFNGKEYSVKTNGMGVAKFKISKKMIKNLKKGKIKYTINYNSCKIIRYLNIA